MADIKVTDMPDIGAPTGTDQLPLVRGGDMTNYSITMTGIAAFAGASIIPSAGVVYSDGSALAAATMGTGVSFSSGTLSNSGLLSISQGTLSVTGTLVAGSGVTLAAGGTITAAGSGGTVTQIVAGTNLTGGTITTMGTVALSPTITISDSSGKLVVDRNSGGTIDLDSNAIEQLVQADATSNGVLLDTFGSTTGRTANFAGRRSNGTRASKTALANNSIIARLMGIGYDGTSYVGGLAFASTPPVAVSLVANEAWSGTAHGTRIDFSAVANGGTSITTAASLTTAQLTLSGGTISTAGNLIVVGGNFTTAGALTFSGAFPVTITATGTTSVTLPTSGTLGTGSVTSVAQTFTGGLISVAGSPVTTAGTLALTVAGTSGGVPYFNSGTSWASSGALAANSVVIGGGAGAAPTGAVLPPGWAITSGTIVPSNTIVVGLSNSLADTITAGTYDLGPFINGGTILNSYAHVVSGTIAFGVAIGQPGTYTDVTGLTTLTSTSTTIDTIGTATAANVISAGAHAWLKVTTGAVGGDVFITVKVP